MATAKHHRDDTHQCQQDDQHQPCDAKACQEIKRLAHLVVTSHKFGINDYPHQDYDK